jgi:transcriptional regulator with XRE-family HTH domain
VPSIGEVLQAARIAQGSSIEEAADHTRVSLRYLQALEANDFEEIPAPVYVRGFLRGYARFLGLNVQPLLDALDDEAYEVGQEPAGLAEDWQADPVAQREAGETGEWSPEDVADQRSRSVPLIRDGAAVDVTGEREWLASEDEAWGEAELDGRGFPWNLVPEGDRGMAIAVGIAIAAVATIAVVIVAV